MVKVSDQSNQEGTDQAVRRGDSTPDVSGLLKTYHLLGLSSFFSLNRFKPGVYVVPYLLLNGWHETAIGQLVLATSIITVTCQGFAGHVIDNSQRKILFLFCANALATLSYFAMIALGPQLFGVFLVLFLDAAGCTLTYPSLYAATLRFVGSENMVSIIPVVESSRHVGNAVFSLAVVVILRIDYLNSGLLWLCAMWFLFACCIVQFLLLTELEFHNLRVAKCGAKASEASTLFSVLTDTRLQFWNLWVFVFHFSNAAMLPLLLQIHFVDVENSGYSLFSYMVKSMALSQVFMAISSSLFGRLMKHVQLKSLSVLCLALVTLRAFCIISLLEVVGSYHTALVCAQVIDGIANGFFGAVLVTAVEHIARESGRFGLLLGIVKSSEVAAGMLSIVVAEVIAEKVDYNASFSILGAVSFLPLVLYILRQKWLKTQNTRDSSFEILPMNSTHSEFAESDMESGMGSRESSTVSTKSVAYRSLLESGVYTKKKNKKNKKKKQGEPHSKSSYSGT